MSARPTGHLYLVTVLQGFMILRVPLDHKGGVHTFCVNSELQDCSIRWNPGNLGSAKCPEVHSVQDFIVYATLSSPSVAQMSEWLKKGGTARVLHIPSKAWKLSLVLAAGKVLHFVGKP